MVFTIEIDSKFDLLVANTVVENRLIDLSMWD